MTDEIIRLVSHVVSCTSVLCDCEKLRYESKLAASINVRPVYTQAVYTLKQKLFQVFCCCKYSCVSCSRMATVTTQLHWCVLWSHINAEVVLFHRNWCVHFRTRGAILSSCLRLFQRLFEVLMSTMRRTAIFIRGKRRALLTRIGK